MKSKLLVLNFFLIVLLGGCAASSEKTSMVEEARNSFQNMAQSDAQRYAPVEYQKAEEALNELNRLLEEGADQPLIEHQAYITNKRVDIAQETADMKKAENYISQAESRRQEILLSQRDRQTQEALQRAEQLESELDNLKTEQTDRGIVLTLDTIVFDVNEATLNPGANMVLDEVAGFLREYENRTLVIEGFTDSSGEASYNEELSQRRAESVKQALVSRGIDENRIETRGYGERFPVATNNTNVGRQLNRRVEIVISNGQEVVQERAS